MARADQLVFDIAPPPSYAVEDYIAGQANELARSTLDRLEWPVSVALVLGEAGSGKTHLAHIAATKAGNAIWFEGTTPSHLEHAALVVIDGLQQWFQGDEDQLFHTLEAARAAQVPVLVTSRTPPEQLGLKRPDTVSRLRAGLRAHIGLPDDSLFAAIAVKLFTDRQLMVEPSIADYLLQRMERSYANLAQLIVLIDEQSLAAGRSITKPLAGQVLKAFELSQS